MKVLLINGSRRPKGCTYTALNLVAGELNAAGIETELLQVGHGVLAGELDSLVKKALTLMRDVDGLVIGSPVYFAAASGEVLAFLDRLFLEGNDVLCRKPCACLVSARRAGTTAALDSLNKYPTICQMPVVSSLYWNMVHGHTPEDVMQDLEGVHIMQSLGRNMAWLLNCIAAGKAAGVAAPDHGESVKTNFIR